MRNDIKDIDISKRKLALEEIEKNLKRRNTNCMVNLQMEELYAIDSPYWEIYCKDSVLKDLRSIIDTGVVKSVNYKSGNKDVITTITNNANGITECVIIRNKSNMKFQVTTSLGEIIAHERPTPMYIQPKDSKSVKIDRILENLFAKLRKNSMFTSRDMSREDADRILSNFFKKFKSNK